MCVSVAGLQRSQSDGDLVKAHDQLRLLNKNMVDVVNISGNQRQAPWDFGHWGVRSGITMGWVGAHLAARSTLFIKVRRGGGASRDLANRVSIVIAATLRAC